MPRTTCSKAECGRRCDAHITCCMCFAPFCMDHRDPTTHTCTPPTSGAGARLKSVGLEGAATAALLTAFGTKPAADPATLTSALPVKSAALSEKNMVLARKARMTRIKSRAVGPKGLPADRAFYFESHSVPETVTTPSSVGEHIRTHMAAGKCHCVDKLTVVGKTLDVLAREYGVSNSNSSTDDIARRLHLSVYNTEAATPSVAPLPCDLSFQQLEASGVLENGAQLVVHRGALAE